MSLNQEQLQLRLNVLAARTARDLAERQSVRTAMRELKRALPLLLVVPGLSLMVMLARSSSASVDLSTSFGSFDLGSVIGYVLVAPLPLLIWLGIQVRASLRARPPRERALAVLDRQLALDDRLVTADEFIGLERRTGFEQAAVEDAARAVETAYAVVLPQVELKWRLEPRGLVVVAVALIACVLVAHVELVRAAPLRVDHGHGGDAGIDVASAADATANRTSSGEREPLADDAPPRETRERRPQPAVRSDARATDVPEQVKQSQGETREGQSSDAQASSGAGTAKGAPSNQEQKSAGDAKSTEPPKKAKESAARPDEEQPKKEADEDSGSTAGKGSGKGSNKNSVASPWSSKDQVDTPDDQEIEDDQEFEDDAEEQKSRGGMQPNLRDRRPPVSRDLSIGFGNRPNPDANGRGGPSDQKKSRGTASLVLGVPVPDRVKGQPNKGKTKITQERVEPRAEVADPVAAGERSPSTTPSGSVPTPCASPFLRDAVRSYFMALRARAAQ